MYIVRGFREEVLKVKWLYGRLDGWIVLWLHGFMVGCQHLTMKPYSHKTIQPSNLKKKAA